MLCQGLRLLPPDEPYAAVMPACIARDCREIDLLTADGRADPVRPRAAAVGTAAAQSGLTLRHVTARCRVRTPTGARAGRLGSGARPCRARAGRGLGRLWRLGGQGGG